MAGEWLNTLYFDAEGVESRTTKDQKAIEAKVGKFYRLNLIIKDEQHYVLDRVGTILFIQRSTVRLSTGYSSLHCSQPWLVYWTMHGLDVLNAIPQDSIAKGVSTLCRCQDATRGGFGGGPDQLPHCLASYAAINAYATLGSEEGYRTIDRLKMYKFLMAMKDPVHGGFASQNDGELDIRSTYCALSIASMLNLLTPELAKNSAKYIASCQTYEGGMGGTPGAEAHGGYAFCGLAGLVLLGQTDAVDISALLVRFNPNRERTHCVHADVFRSLVTCALTKHVLRSIGPCHVRCRWKEGSKDGRISWSTRVTRSGRAPYFLCCTAS
eukprot:TRINITY_DN1622_c0_g3_i2.p1 TRINITY_DN1622_c0_g3~~TRINITY_DN1622_c0_g3_i2.p1  ORF type:complete len:367 (-),score=29.36 TRINITY_DN1622_c0_g3_i2:950-1924(-)